MVVTSSGFLGIYKKFQTQDLVMIEFCLDQAKTLTPITLWGEKRDLGVILATAHLLEMEDVQTASTASTAIAMASGSGGQSPSASEIDWQLTTYGRRYAEIKKQLQSGEQSPKIDDSDTWDGAIRFSIGFPT